MDIKARVVDNVVVLDLSGSIDVNAANLIEVIGQCLRDGYCDILCDCEDIENIDYMGISVIVIAYKEVLNSKGRMKFSSIPTHLKQFFSVTGLDKSLEIYPTQEVAIKSFSEDKVIENIKRMQLRRRFKRLPIDLKVQLRSKSNREISCLKFDILNLSAVGAYIYGCGEFKLGDDLLLKFKLPTVPQEIELEGVVVWLSDKQVQQHIHPGMAVEFRNISTSLQEKILEFIERNLPLGSTDS